MMMSVEGLVSLVGEGYTRLVLSSSSNAGDIVLLADAITSSQLASIVQTMHIQHTRQEEDEEEDVEEEEEEDGQGKRLAGRKLVKINLSSSRRRNVYFDQTSLGNIVQLLVRQCPNLVEISFRGIGAVRNSSVVEEIKNFLVNSVDCKVEALDLGKPFEDVDVGYGDAAADMIALIIYGSRSIRKLGLSESLLRNEGLENVCDAIKSSRFLQVLDLSKNGFDASQCGIIADFLKGNVVLQVLDLSDNNFGDKGVVELANGLLENRSIRSLNISKTNAENEGIIQLSKWILQSHHLNELVIQSTSFKYPAIEAFCSAISQNDHLFALDVSFSFFENEDLLIKAITNHESLEKVSLEGLVIKWANLQGLGKAMQNSIVESIKLSNNTFERASDPSIFLDEAVKSEYIKELNFRGISRIEDWSACTSFSAFCSHLTNSNLDILDLSGSNLGEVGSKHLLESIKSSQVTELKVSNCCIPPLNVKYLFTILSEKGSSIEKLDLSGNKIEKGSYPLILKTLQGNPMLKDLRLNACDLENAFLEMISQNFSSIQWLNSFSLQENLFTKAALKSFFKLIEHSKSLINLEIPCKSPSDQELLSKTLFRNFKSSVISSQICLFKLCKVHKLNPSIAWLILRLSNLDQFRFVVELEDRKDPIADKIRSTCQIS